MKIKLTKILSRVYSLLNENETILEERVEYGEPTAMIKPLILDLLPQAADCVIAEAPLSQIDDGVTLSTLPSTDEASVYLLPDDFARLICMRMSDGSEPITATIAFESEEYRLRFNETAHRRSRAVAICNYGTKRYLRVFRSDRSATITEFIYVPKPAMSETDIELPPGLLSEVCARTARMVLDIIS